MSDLDVLINDVFGDVAVDKRLSAQVGLADRAIPAYVVDWLVARHLGPDGLDRNAVQAFITKHMPEKGQNQLILKRLTDGESVTILDSLSVRVDLKTGHKLAAIPLLDLNNAVVEDYLLDRNPLLLVGNVWGAVKLRWRQDPVDPEKYRVWVEDFKPMQTSGVDLDFFREARTQFSLSQWREVLVRSLGYNPAAYSPEQQQWVLTRLVPMVQSRCNLMELAPKGTGKSTIFSRLSRYNWLISGGTVTRAQLFYDMGRRTAGLITRYDVVVLDEVQTLQFDNPAQIIGAMKGYLEQGEFSVSQFKASAESGMVLLANIPIGSDGQPLEEDYLRTLPEFLQETALMDRFHGILPGWKIPRITKESIAATVGLKADYLAEVLHLLRFDTQYMEWVINHISSTGDLRDIRAVERISAGLLKLYFPDLSDVSPAVFAQYCLEPAKQMRRMIRKQLSLRDPEYKPTLAQIELKT